MTQALKVMHMARRAMDGTRYLRRALCSNAQAWHPRLTSDPTVVSCKNCLRILRVPVRDNNGSGGQDGRE